MPFLTKEDIINLNWSQNIESIFTKEQLEDFVKNRFLEKVEDNKRVYYIKKGCKKWFMKY